MKILVVEDEQKLLSFLKESLEAEFYAVDTAEDGEKGLWLAKVNEYDLILLDNQLPKKTGLQVCQELRAEGKRAPILIVSVRNETITKIDLFNAGADDYLTKPFVLEELLARIRALLRRPQVLAGETLVVGDLKLDVLTGNVVRAGTPIYLTRKEFTLLHYLMRHEGIVLSRGMILEHVWDMNVDILSNTVESHILSLRKKLGEMQRESKLIHTIPGRGYKLEAV